MSLNSFLLILILICTITSCGEVSRSSAAASGEPLEDFVICTYGPCGLTYRDIMAMSYINGVQGALGIDEDVIANHAYAYAEAMLKARQYRYNHEDK
jgi:hypothetical protein